MFTLDVTARTKWIAWCSLVIWVGSSGASAAFAQASPQPKAAEAKPAQGQGQAQENAPAKPPKPKASSKQTPSPRSQQAAAVAQTAPAAPAKGAEQAKPAEAEKPVLAVAQVKPAAPPPPAAAPKPQCTLADAEQPRGGRLEVLSESFGSSPVVRISGKPARMIERRADRVSVQVPADSDGGQITLLHDGRSSSCGNLVIIGKNR